MPGRARPHFQLCPGLAVWDGAAMASGATSLRRKAEVHKSSALMGTTVEVHTLAGLESDTHELGIDGYDAFELRCRIWNQILAYWVPISPRPWISRREFQIADGWIKTRVYMLIFLSTSMDLSRACVHPWNLHFTVSILDYTTADPAVMWRDIFALYPIFACLSKLILPRYVQFVKHPTWNRSFCLGVDGDSQHAVQGLQVLIRWLYRDLSRLFQNDREVHISWN